MSRCTLDPALLPLVSCTGLSPSLAGFPKTIPLQSEVNSAVRTPWCTHHGLGSAGFARRYSRYRCFFLFLRLLRCFSSPGSPPYVMDWRMDDRGLLCRVSPFRYLRINGYLLLPAAFRSLSRLSSALSAKASTLRSSSLNHHMYSVTCVSLGFCCLLLIASFWKQPLGCLVINHLPSLTSGTRKTGFPRSWIFAEYPLPSFRLHPLTRKRVRAATANPAGCSTHD